MHPNFDLGTKHTEYKKQTQAILAEITAASVKDVVIALREKAVGLLPGDSLYNDYLGLVASVEEVAKAKPEAASLIVDQVIAQRISSNIDKSSIYAVLCSEPGIATIEGLKAKAEKTDKGFNVLGVKQVTKEQLIADKFLVFAKDESGSVRVFELSKDQITVSQVEREVVGKNLKINQVEINTCVSDSVAVIDSKFEEVQAVSRTLIAAVALGIAHNALISGINAVKQTKGADGLALSNTQSAQFQLADLFGELEAGRVLTYNSACLIDAGTPSIKFATMAKVQSTNAAARVSMEAMQLLGNIGYLADDGFASVLQAAFNTQIKGGTNRVQKNQLYGYMLAKK